MLRCCAGGNATIDPSTVFLDYLGPLGGSNMQTWSNTSEDAAVAKAAHQITSAVRQGFLTRAAADWNVRSLWGVRHAWSLAAGPALPSPSEPHLGRPINVFCASAQ